MKPPPHRYLALLRGINVGGNHIIGKDELKACFESLELENVRTYIQSGNVLFRAKTRSRKKLTQLISPHLAATFDYHGQLVVYSQKEYGQALAAAPPSWGHDEDWKHNAIFVFDGTDPEDVLAQLPEPKPKIEQVSVGPRVVYWSALKKSLTRTTMMRLAKAPIYRQVTVRNHNTTWKLAALFDEI